jgi:putative endonuclease
MSFRLRDGWEKLTARWRWFWGIRQTPIADTLRQARGRMGEAAAVEHLETKDFVIIARNWRQGNDELDIVARDGPNLVFCEVRTRAATALVSGYFSVTTKKKRAVLRAAKAYLHGLAAPPAHFRFDIVEVKVSDGRAAEVLHHPNVPLFPKHFHLHRDIGFTPSHYG